MPYFMYRCAKISQDFSIPQDPQPGRFYLLSKIHKPNNPGRPIVSNIDTLTEHISQHVEHNLKPHAQAANSYIQDTTDFLNKLASIDSIPPGSLLATMDVTSLYSNITHERDVQALKNRLSDEFNTSLILCLTQFIHEHNYFKFIGNMLLQVKGTAMGTRMALQYANIFLANSEERFLQSFPMKPLLYLCFIDDIFLLWPHGEKSLLQFHSRLNMADPHMKLTLDYSSSSVNFLDTFVTLHKYKISTTLYRKPTHTHSYVHATSFHPKHVFNSVVYSQALRYNRICSDTASRDLKLHKLKNGLKI